MIQCSTCGDNIRAFTAQKLCSACETNQLITKQRTKRHEKYEPAIDGLPPRATWSQPPTFGLAVLTQFTRRLHFSDITLTHAQIRSMNYMEQQQGLNNLEGIEK